MSMSTSLNEETDAGTDTRATTGLRLEPVTPDTVDAAIDLRVHPHQEDNVAPVVRSLAEAYAYGDGAWPRLIFDGDRLVGFLMAFLDLPWDGAGRRSGLWRLNIDAGQQGKGYGRYAVRAVAEELRRRGADEMYVTWHQGEHGPGAFYRGLGFRETGEMSGDQAVGLLDLRDTGAGGAGGDSNGGGGGGDGASGT
ncbi:acetyltransferase [Streptomyces laurentii]|uniref:Acetyltransferase n=2 Tax=Streptomyces laurentii TaxID=39478 RepID=A0A160P0R8_STRLU|nr:acetyltransferase [Streptomyces laurentii]